MAAVDDPAYWETGGSCEISASMGESGRGGEKYIFTAGQSMTMIRLEHADHGYLQNLVAVEYVSCVEEIFVCSLPW